MAEIRVLYAVVEPYGLIAFELEVDWLPGYPR
jgi:hypothetical protein